MVFADLPTALEAVPLEHRHGGVVEKRARDLPPWGVLPLAFPQTAAQSSYFVERGGEGGVRHPPMPVRAANEKAGDAPVGQFVQPSSVRLLVLDPRQLLRRSELTPPDTLRAVVDERRMRPAFPHSRLLE